MKVEYTYHFANGEKLSISIEESERDLLAEFDRQEYNNNQTARRKKASLDTLNQDDSHFASGEDIAKTFEESEMFTDLYKAIETLLPNQKELIKEVFYDEMRLAHIADKEGVSRAALTQRMNRILEKLKKFLD